LFAIGISLLALFADGEASYWTLYLPAMLLTGAGVGFTISTLGSASNAYLPPDRFAMGSAFNVTCRQVGAALGIAVVAAIRAASDDPLAGFDRAWVFIVICAVVSGVTMGALYRRPTAAEMAAAEVDLASASATA
jgi:hypothetical protein